MKIEITQWSNEHNTAITDGLGEKRYTRTSHKDKGEIYGRKKKTPLMPRRLRRSTIWLKRHRAWTRKSKNHIDHPRHLIRSIEIQESAHLIKRQKVRAENQWRAFQKPQKLPQPAARKRAQNNADAETSRARKRPLKITLTIRKPPLNRLTPTNWRKFELPNRSRRWENHVTRDTSRLPSCWDFAEEISRVIPPRF